MKSVKIVIGANFGDEGKGLMTDYFCSAYPSNKKVLNIRFNGGAQAGHTVVKQDGRRHVFNHLGSGSFNKNNITYLSSYFIVNPMLFVKEYSTLGDQGVTPKVLIHKDCIVTFPCDMLVNQLVEAHRNNNRHGSCGIGIYETILRTNNHKKVTIEYLSNNLDAVTSIITDAITDYLPKRLGELGVELNTDDWELAKNINILNNYLVDLEFLLKHTEIVDDSIISRYNNIVFEGAQGLLLDANNTEYYPNLTPSSTGLDNVMKILKGVKNCNISVCYVTRSYFTRHGAGMFKTECDSTQIRKEGLVDKTNQTNNYQGNFRYGYFDITTLNEHISKDLRLLNRHATIALAITHLDETDWRIVTKDGKKINVTELLTHMNIDNVYVSNGESAENIQYKPKLEPNKLIG